MQHSYVDIDLPSPPLMPCGIKLNGTIIADVSHYELLPSGKYRLHCLLADASDFPLTDEKLRAMVDSPAR